MINLRIPVGDLQPGQYFKANRKWYLADSVPRRLTGGDAWTVAAFDSTKGGRWPGYLIYDETVAVAVPGDVPAPFRPATLRRRAKQAEALAAQLRDDAEALGKLADALEKDDAQCFGAWTAEFITSR